jgi:hypothetical protein
MTPAARHAVTAALAAELTDALPPDEYEDAVEWLRDLDDDQFAAIAHGAAPPAGRTFDDEADRDPPPEGRSERVPGPGGDLLTALLRAAVRLGGESLGGLARDAVARYLGGRYVPGGLFLGDERQALAGVLYAILGTSDLAGRATARGLLPGDGGEAAGPPPVDYAGVVTEVARLEPAAAVEYLKGLAPAVGVDPGRYGDSLRRRAFTLAVATEAELAERVKAAVVGALGDGTDATPRVQDVLDAAGVSPRNPQYAEMVARTNTLEALTTASWEEMTAPDVSVHFPAWTYANPDDSRSRPEHAARNGRVYPASLPFAVVRGTDIADVANCRCVPIPMTRRAYDRHLAAGGRVWAER